MPICDTDYFPTSLGSLRMKRDGYKVTQCGFLNRVSTQQTLSLKDFFVCFGGLSVLNGRINDFFVPVPEEHAGGTR